MKQSAIVFLLVVACASSFAIDGKTVKTEETSLNLPDDWKTNKSSPLYLYELMSPDYSVTGNLFTEDLNEATSPDGYYDEAVADIKKLMPDMKILETGDDYHLFSATILGYQIVELQFFFFFDNRIFILTFALTSEELTRYREMLFAIARSFEYHP